MTEAALSLRAETSQRNGARSLGPVTAEGKAASALNRVAHGLNARALLLADEQPADYEENLRDWVTAFSPRTAVEADLLADAADLAYRLGRLRRLEERQIQEALADQKAKSPVMQKAQHARDTLAALSALGSFARSGPPSAEAFGDVSATIRAVASMVAKTTLPYNLMRDFEAVIQNVTLGDLLGQEATVDAFMRLANAAQALATELEAMVPELEADVLRHQPFLADAALASDSKGTRKLERMRAVLQRALERQLALVKQGPDACDAPNVPEFLCSGALCVDCVACAGRLAMGGTDELRISSGTPSAGVLSSSMVPS